MGKIDLMSARELQVIQECLDAAVHGPFFPDWEFHTLMGFTRDQIAVIAQAWPNNEDSEDQDDAVNNVLNMLLGYPHGYERRWQEYFSVTPQEIAQTLTRWRGDDTFDDTGKGTFDRLR
jgi:hypothetical protein